ncbi:hypothetical protein LWE61_03180 [Sphingobium sufflavum]|uniref:hypothetical protein n=1 Tax=Sphingobium sufflavum TaxID=1129547 RepID=UPI001F23051A|nr:hypothetical protein [Sphingobium sufflavum]MCE7795555.1 hypothetical protein [Sphingobium sufflavum]
MVVGEPTTIKRIVELLLTITDFHLEVHYVDGGGAAKSTNSTQLDLSREKIDRLLGWRLEIGIEEGLRRLIAWRAMQAA